MMKKFNDAPDIYYNLYYKGHCPINQKGQIPASIPSELIIET